MRKSECQKKKKKRRSEQHTKGEESNRAPGYQKTDHRMSSLLAEKRLTGAKRWESKKEGRTPPEGHHTTATTAGVPVKSNKGKVCVQKKKKMKGALDLTVNKGSIKGSKPNEKKGQGNSPTPMDVRDVLGG